MQILTSVTLFFLLQAAQGTDQASGWDLQSLWDGPPWYVRLYLTYLICALFIGPVYVVQMWRSFGLTDTHLQKAASQDIHAQLNRFRNKAHSLVTHLGVVALLLFLTLSMAVGNVVRELAFARGTDKWWLYWLAEVLPMFTFAALVVVVLFICHRYLSGRVEKRQAQWDYFRIRASEAVKS